MSTKKGTKLNKVKRGGTKDAFSEEASIGLWGDVPRNDTIQPDLSDIRTHTTKSRKKQEEDNKEENEEVMSGDEQLFEEEQLNRKEREEQEKLRSKEAFWKAHEQGKTDQAKSDLARLAIIKKQREEAARKRLEDQSAKGGQKQASLNAGKGIISKSLGK